MPSDPNINDDFIEGLLQDPYEDDNEKPSSFKELKQEAVSNQSTPTNGTLSVSPEDVLQRSIFIKNVDYTATTQQLEEHFQDCGQILRTTIRVGPGGKPIGCAYMEFASLEAALRSKKKNETLFLGRQITVMAKRKNLPKSKERRPQFGGSGPMMMQACAMMMAACSGQRGMGYNQFQRNGFRGRGGQFAVRGRGGPRH